MCVRAVEIARSTSVVDLRFAPCVFVKTTVRMITTRMMSEAVLTVRYHSRTRDGTIESMERAIHGLSRMFGGRLPMKKQANQALQPTRMLVTFYAYAQPAPSTHVADL